MYHQAAARLTQIERPCFFFVFFSRTKIITFRTMLVAETWTTYQRWVRNMKLEMYVGVVNLFPPRLHYVYFSLFSLLK